MAETLYDVLGVSPDASEPEITDAYRERIKETHPDVSDAADAEARARRVIEAKEVLTDADERARYDRLGHDAYVRETSTDASWATGGRTAGSAGAADRSASTTGTSASDAAGGVDWSSSDSETGTWAGRGDWRDDSDARSNQGRRHRQRARREHANASSSSNGGGGTGDGSSDGTGGTDGSGSSSGASRGTGTTGNVGGPVGWATSTRHAVRNERDRTGVYRSRLFPPGQSAVLLVSTFICYPAMVFSSVFPPFPLLVNLVVGVCTLFLIAYLTSMPEVGIYVFGGWAVLATLALIASSVSPFSLIGVLVLGSTWFPLGLTLLTFRVLRW